MRFIEINVLNRKISRRLQREKKTIPQQKSTNDSLDITSLKTEDWATQKNSTNRG